MNIEIGKKYDMGSESVEVLGYSKKNEVLLVAESDGNLVFVLGLFAIQDGEIISNKKLSYTVTKTEMLDCINTYLAQNNEINTSVDLIVKAIQNTYYKIPTQLAEVVAEWYME